MSISAKRLRKCGKQFIVVNISDRKRDRSMDYILKLFDKPLIRFHATEDSSDPEITIHWIDESVGPRGRFSGPLAGLLDHGVRG